MKSVWFLLKSDQITLKTGEFWVFDVINAVTRP